MDISKLLPNMEFYKIRVTNDGEVIVHRCVASEFQTITTLSGKRQFKYLEWYPNGTCERAWGNEDQFDKVLCDRYGRIAFCLVFYVHEVEYIRYSLPYLSLALVKNFHSESDILIYRLLLKKSEVLEYHTYLLSDSRYFSSSYMRDVLARKKDLALVRLYLLKDEPYESRFAGAARTYKKNKVAPVDMNRSVYESDILAVFLGNILEFYHFLKALFSAVLAPAYSG